MKDARPKTTMPSQSDLLRSSSAASPQTSTTNSQPLCVPDHVLLQRIGRGSYGEVWLARNIVGTWRAVKVVRRATFERVEHFEREFRGIQRFEPISRSHEGFVDILQIGRNDESGYFYYVMELADDANAPVAADVRRLTFSDSQLSTFNSRPEDQSLLTSAATYVPKTLRAAIRSDSQLSTPNSLPAPTRLPVSDCVNIGITLASALAHLHKHGLVHRDIKPSNIIFVGGVPKLADIGLVADASEARSFVGTVGFIPPEGPGSPQADLYSLGKVLYEISTGQDRQDFPQLPPDLLRGTAPGLQATLSHPMGEGLGVRATDVERADQSRSSRREEAQSNSELGTQNSELEVSLLTSAATSSKDALPLIELNEVLLKACHKDVRQRYPSADAMRAELELLQRGQSVQRKHAAERRWTLVKRIGLAAAAMVALVAVLPYVKLGKPQRNGAPPAEINSIAVLPFVNESKSPAHEYLCNALTDETMNALTNCARLRVASHSAVFAFRRTTNSLRQVGEQLGARTVLAGSMKESSNQLHIAARLIRVADGSNVWSVSYDREPRDIGTMQSEVVRQVARLLNLSLNDRALRRLEANLVRKLAAYQLVRQSYSIADDTQDGLNKIIQLLNRALVEDPDFAQPYARLAHFYAETSGWMLPPEQSTYEAKKNALRAIQLDDSLGEAHMALGNVLWRHDLDFAKAEAEFQHGIEVDPDDVGTYGFYAIGLSQVGRYKHAEKVLNQGNQVSRNAQIILAGWCWRYYLDHRFDELLGAATNYLAVLPEHRVGLRFVGWAQERLGRYEEALATAQKMSQLSPGLDFTAFLGRVHARMGHRDEAQKVLDQLRVLTQSPRASGLYSAEVLLALGDNARAIEHLRQAVDEYPPTVLRLKTDPQWDDLRSDSRFIALLKKAGLGR